MSAHKDAGSPQGTSAHDNGMVGRDERVVEYLRQRLATVVATGSAAAAAMKPDVEEEQSRFSPDLEDDKEGGSDQNGSKDAYPNIHAESWDDDELDPAWIIDRYCSWQEEDLEDALMEEEEGSAVNQLLSGVLEDRKEGRDEETSESIALQSPDLGPNSKGNRFTRHQVYKLSLITFRLSRDKAVGKDGKDTPGIHTPHASFSVPFSVTIAAFRVYLRYSHIYFEDTR
jgi:hypothetical protein